MLSAFILLCKSIAKIAMCRLWRHGLKSKRVGRDGPHAQKLHAPYILNIIALRLQRMKF
jgi:hypothetical protein